MRDEIEMRIAHINGRFGRLGPHARRVRPSLGLAVRAGRALPARRRDDGDAAPRRHEPRRPGVRLCQTDDPGGGASWRGALLLSEFAGAAHVLPGAVLVNPWDADELAARLVEALALDAPERRRRLELMADRVEQLDSAQLGAVVPRAARAVRAPGGPARRGRSTATARSRDRPAARGGAEAHAHARLRRDAPRARRPSGPRRPRPPRSASCSRPRRAARRRASTSSAAGRARRSRPGSATCPISALRRARLPRSRRRAASGRTPLDVDLSLAPARRAAAPARRGATSRERWSSGRPRASPGTIARPSPSTASGGPASSSSRSRTLLGGHLRRGSPGPPRDRGPRARRQQGRVPRAVPAPTLRRTPGIVLAAGDDVTDNDLFRVLPDGSIAIHVGGIRQGARRTPLEHEYVVENPAALRSALREMVLAGLPGSTAGSRKTMSLPHDSLEGATREGCNSQLRDITRAWTPNHISSFSGPTLCERLPTGRTSTVTPSPW